MVSLFNKFMSFYFLSFYITKTEYDCVDTMLTNIAKPTFQMNIFTHAALFHFSFCHSFLFKSRSCSAAERP